MPSDGRVLKDAARAGGRRGGQRQALRRSGAGPRRGGRAQELVATVTGLADQLYVADPDDGLARSVEPEIRIAIHAAATGAGFRFAAVDLKGMQSGAFTLTLLNHRGQRRA